MWVKICGITTVEDAEAAATFGADAVGLVFADSPRKISLEQASRISQALNGGPQKVGVFVDSPLEEVLETVRCCDLDLVQLCGSEGSEYCSRLGDTAIKAVHVNGGIDLAGASGYGCGALLFEGKGPRPDGGGGSFDWTLLRLLDRRMRVIVAGGLGPDNVAAAVKAARPFGVDVSSGVERSPGLKDPVLMYRFIERARKAEYEVNGC